MLEYYGENRRITIAKSPISPVVSIPFKITSAGIELITMADKTEIVEINPENYWQMKIIPRSLATPGF